MCIAVGVMDRYEAAPSEHTGAGVLVLAGSSGRVESARADRLASTGVRATAIRWFGGEHQRPVPHEVPIELFLRELDALRADCDRVAILGTSFGAEAALVTASLTPVDAVIAIAPSAVIWGGVHEGEWSSHWTHAGTPLPWLPFDPQWTPDADPPSYRELYLRSLERDAAATEAASIAVERIAGDLLLIAGGDDQVWPSDEFATMIAERRAGTGLATEVVSHPDAGHRLLLPGEQPASGGVRMRRGGSPAADAALGALAWPRILTALGVA